LVDNDDDDEDDIVASVDRSASDGRLNADRRISSMILLLYVLASIGSMLPLAVFYSMGVDGVLLSFLS
jgi:hypothetical protein